VFVREEERARIRQEDRDEKDAERRAKSSEAPDWADARDEDAPTWAGTTIDLTRSDSESKEK
jgi:hypothetical protein